MCTRRPSRSHRTNALPRKPTAIIRNCRWNQSSRNQRNRLVLKMMGNGPKPSVVPLAARPGEQQIEGVGEDDLSGQQPGVVVDRPPVPAPVGEDRELHRRLDVVLRAQDRLDRRPGILPGILPAGAAGRAPPATPGARPPRPRRTVRGPGAPGSGERQGDRAAARAVSAQRDADEATCRRCGRAGVRGAGPGRGTPECAVLRTPAVAAAGRQASVGSWTASGPGTDAGYCTALPRQVSARRGTAPHSGLHERDGGSEPAVRRPASRCRSATYVVCCAPSTRTSVPRPVLRRPRAGDLFVPLRRCPGTSGRRRRRRRGSRTAGGARSGRRRTGRCPACRSWAVRGLVPGRIARWKQAPPSAGSYRQRRRLRRRGLRGLRPVVRPAVRPRAPRRLSATPRAGNPGRRRAVIAGGGQAPYQGAASPPFRRSNFWIRCPTLTSVVYRLPAESMARLCSR